MAMTSNVAGRKTLAVVLGATATGKTGVGIRLAQAFGSEPMPSWSVEPSAMFCTTYSAIFISSSDAGGDFAAGSGPCGPSTIMSTSSMWMHSLRPP